MSIDQFHGCYPGDTTLSALGNATGSTPRNTSRNNSKTGQEYLKKKNLIITIIIFTNKKNLFPSRVFYNNQISHHDYFGKPPIKRIFGEKWTFNLI